MSQKQRTIEEIIPKRLSLVERTWKTKKDDEETTAYRIRVYSPKTKKYSFITLESISLKQARQEAITKYGELVGDLDKGKPVAGDRKKLSTYINMFMEHMEIRRKNGYCTQHRVVCVRQLLKSLENFAKEHNNPDITNLVSLYENKYMDWRDAQLARLTATPLKPRSRNNEYLAHRQFFTFLKEKHNVLSYVPTLLKMQVEQTNKPFPQDKYNALLKASRDAINGTNHPRIKWNWMTMRTVILLMAGTGCRVSEVKNLKWEHIKYDKKRNITEIFFHGKGKKRTIVISNRVYGYLMDLADFRREWGKSWEWNEKDYPMVFSSWKMAKMLNQFDSWGRRQWYETIGLNPKEYPLVCFRHKFISDALRQGTHALQIAWYVGSSVAMIQKTYGSITSPELFKQVFSNAPEDALERASRSKWFEEQLQQGREKNPIR